MAKGRVLIKEIFPRHAAQITEELGRLTAAGQQQLGAVVPQVEFSGLSGSFFRAAMFCASQLDLAIAINKLLPAQAVSIAGIFLCL